MIVSIAGINFTNFSTALMPMRVRNINTQRVMGAQQTTIRLMFIFEAIVFCLVSYVIALLLAKLFGEGVLSVLISANLSLMHNPMIVGGTALVAIFVGICAGLYPSYHITSFAPALALKGNFGLSPKGKKIRNTLIGVQFTASLILIVGASFIYLQNRMMQNADLGYDTDKIITVAINRISQMPNPDKRELQAMRGSRESRSLFANKLTAHPDIKEVTFAQSILSGSDNFSNFTEPYKGEMITAHIIPVEYDFLEVLEINITEGRSFRQEDIGLPGVLVFNETARRKYNLEVGTAFGNFDIIGFMPDVHYGSMRVAVEPMAFGVAERNLLDYAYVKMLAGANNRAVMSHIRAVLSEFDPNYYTFFDIRFFDETVQQIYARELSLGWLVLIFSMIVVFISIVGVFGLVVFDSECRRKEIGIRRVSGASVMDIILMFNKAYLKILLICFVIAVPLAWYAVSRWLEDFAYRTPMYWWVFLLVFVAVAIITILTVTIQNWKVANDDPVRSIKTE
jgi:putative ABC transport system permease protein